MVSTLPQNNQPKRRSGVSSLVVLIILLVASAMIWTNRQYLQDGVIFLLYQPSNMVATIASSDTLTSGGKFIFYASQPSIDERAKFNQECDRKESGTAILGCYTGNRIYVYDVTDPKLNGIQEVTAAHEMLHAVYQRMSQADRDSVNKLVEAEYQKLKSNPDYTQRMAFYDRTEPGERDNELHSIIGTEVGSISPELEAHYAKYFADRSKVVGFYDSYNSAFTTLAAQASQLSDQLNSLNDQIKTASAQYNADVQQLNDDIATFNQQAASGNFASQAEFDAKRQTLVDRADEVNGERNSVNALIDRYNELRNEYNNIVTQSNNLYDSIDSSLAPAPTVK